MGTLERITKSILERLQALEEKIENLESLQQRNANSTSSSPAVVGGGPIATVNNNDGSPTKALGDDVRKKTHLSLDSEAVKKGLLAKMWKYLNDERSTKAA